MTPPSSSSPPAAHPPAGVPPGGSRPAAPRGLTLNVAPIAFSADRVRVGRTRFTDDDAYDRLREAHRGTHAFRYDRETGDIVSVALDAAGAPVGAAAVEPVRDHLLLLGKAVQRTLLRWLEPRYLVVRPSRPVTFWGRNERSLLLTKALADAGLEPTTGVEVLGRFDLDTRVLDAPGEASGDGSGDGDDAFLGLVIDADTANVLDLSVATLVARGVDVTGLYVCRRGEGDPDSPYAPTPGAGVIERLDTLGFVRAVRGGELLLGDPQSEAPGADRVAADAVVLEPKQENLERVVRALYPRQADRVLQQLRALREPFTTAPGKLAVIQELLAGITASVRFTFGDGLTARPGALLTAGAPLFPSGIATGRPTCLFGPQGRETDEQPDRGIQRHGPYQYLLHERTAPVLAVVCEARQQGRMEQFLADLRHGVSDDAWAAANRWRQGAPPAHPYRGGLIGKYRLQRVQVEIETVKEPTPAAYRAAIDRLLSRLPDTPDLALVQTRESFKRAHGDQNPYFVAKAAFMTAGVPVQAVQAETFECRPHQLPYRLNNLSLQVYAKLDGVPWVITTRQPSSHELVVGLGYTEVGEGRFGDRTRYVGITTLFQGDGRYLLWGRTREVEFSQYADALLESLRVAVDHARTTNN